MLKYVLKFNSYKLRLCNINMANLYTQFFTYKHLCLALCLCISILITGCQHNGAKVLHTFVQTNALKWKRIATQKHDILILTSKQFSFQKGHSLHVYLEGDGSPWFRGIRPNKNPTSTSLLSLKMMLQDSHPSIYLNRPCYGFSEIPDGCNDTLWTSARYSKEVVDAMNDALNQIKIDMDVDRFTLIGHSGGGSIAVLLAKNRQDIDKVITIAGNLDHRAWTRHFRYEPLTTSLNPRDYLPLDKSIKRWHLFGVQDKIIPLPIFDSAVENENATIIKYFNFDHICCWLTKWPEIIEKIENNEVPNS